MSVLTRVSARLAAMRAERRRSRGVTSVEYALIVGLVAVVVFGAASLITN